MDISVTLFCAVVTCVYVTANGQSSILTNSSSLRPESVRQNNRTFVPISETRHNLTHQENSGNRRVDRIRPTRFPYRQGPYPTPDYNYDDGGTSTGRPNQNQPNQGITPDPETVAYITNAIRAYQPGSPGSPFSGIPFNPFLPPSSTVRPTETRNNETLVHSPQQLAGFPGYLFTRNNGNVPYFVVPFLPANTRGAGLPNLPSERPQPTQSYETDHQQSPSPSERRRPPVSNPSEVTNNAGYYVFPPPPASTNAESSQSLEPVGHDNISQPQDYSQPTDYPSYDYDYRQRPNNPSLIGAEEIEHSTEHIPHQPSSENDQNQIHEHRNRPQQEYATQRPTTNVNYYPVDNDRDQRLNDHRNIEYDHFDGHNRHPGPPLTYARGQGNRQNNNGRVIVRNRGNNHFPQQDQIRFNQQFRNGRPVENYVPRYVYNVPTGERVSGHRTVPSNYRPSNFSPQVAVDGLRGVPEEPGRTRTNVHNPEYIPFAPEDGRNIREGAGSGQRPFYRDGRFNENGFQRFRNGEKEDRRGRSRPFYDDNDFLKDFEKDRLDIEKQYGGEEIFPTNASRIATIRLRPELNEDKLNRGNDFDTKDRNSSRQHGTSVTVPACAVGSNFTFCLEDVNYPRENVTKSVHDSETVIEHLLRGNLASVHQRLSETTRDHTNALYSCPSTVHYARPLRAISTSGKWKTIVNLSETMRNNAKPEQVVRMELCLNPKTSCSYPNSDRSSYCHQKQVRQRLLAWSEEKGLHVDFFEFPVACTCGAA